MSYFSLKRCRKALILPICSVLLYASLPTSASAREASSTSFVLSQATVNSGGGSSTSSSFVLDATLAQSTPAGTSVSSSFVLQAGFWTNLSTRNMLRVDGSGSGNGSVVATGIACSLAAGEPSGDCRESLLHGADIDLVATPDPGHRFDGWSGCDSTFSTVYSNDTCRLSIFDERAVTAAFTALGSVGDRIWRDVDGDGGQDVGEPGLAGVAVSIDDGNGLSGSVVTGSDGAFGFVDVPPGTYTLWVDPLTLPAGSAPSFDPDGVATPHTTSISLVDGEDLNNADFGYQPQTNLAITLVDSEDPLPGGTPLTYLASVQNLGPGIATGIEVDLSPPVGTTLVSTTGCAEDPIGAPVCTLPTLQVGETASFSLEVSIDPAPPGVITASAAVFAVEVDLDILDNTANETTALDNRPPTTTQITTGLPAHGELAECETVNDALLTQLSISFDEPMFNPAGHTTPGDITNPAGWLLVAAGDDAELDTTACGEPIEDDVSIPVVAVSYDALSHTAVLNLGAGLDAAQLRLFACGTGENALRDLGGTPLDGDGDGTSGGDFVRQFRTDPDNLFTNGSLDCSLDGWATESEEPDEIFHSSDDWNGSATSGSVALTSRSSGNLYALSQCVRIDPDQEHSATVRLRLEAEASHQPVQLRFRCIHYRGPECQGEELRSDFKQESLPATTDTWIAQSWQFLPPEAGSSAYCRILLSHDGEGALDARLDDLSLVPVDGIFTDGFESGDTSLWSSETP